MKVEFFNNRGTFPKAYSMMVSAHMKKTIGKVVTIEYKAQVATRTLLQNKYYWGVIIKMLSQEIGYDPEVVHDYMKKLFLGYETFEFPDGDHHVLKSTTDLDTVKIEEYFKKIRNWSGDFLNCYIPLPNETDYNYLELN